MNKSVLLILLVVLLNACSSDFNVGADYKEVTIVYGLLDDADAGNYHYLKVMRGFFSESENNILIAQNKDSIYFKDLTVTIDELNNGTLVKTINCTEVDLNASIPVAKQEGVFLANPNIGFQFIHDLNPKYTYRLKVVNNESGKVVTAETPIISAEPTGFNVIYPFTNTDQLNFDDPNKNYTFIWKTPKDGYLYDVLLRFNYFEKNINTQVITKKHVDLPLAKFVENPSNGGDVSVQVPNQYFYSLLNGKLGDGGTDYVRYVDTPDLYFIAGSLALKQYIDVNTAQGGLTNDQIKPVFTNLQGENVLGIFSTRATRALYNIPFTNGTFDSIISGQFTKSLNIIARSPE